VIETNGTERTFFAYHPAFTGGVRVALGDVNGDGVLDIVTAPGPGGGPHVRVWNGVDLTEIGGFFAYDPAFPGGVWVAAGDVDGDGRADVITGAGPGGGPHVRVWSGVDFHEIGGFFAYSPAFPGGVTVAAGDVDGDGRADIISGAGPGGGPHVRVWSGATFNEIGGFFAYDPAFPGGVSVAAGDVNNDGRADIITGAGPGGGPHVRVWNATNFSEIGGFFAYDPAFSGGIQVGAIDLTGDNRAEIITGVGPGGPPLSSIWNGADLSLMGTYFAFDPSLRVGVFVGSVGKSSPVRFTSANATSFTLGAAGSFTITTAGGVTPPTLTISGALPSGVTFTDNGNGTATLAGMPGAGTAGTYPLTFSASTGTPPVVTQSFTLTVRQGPAITSANSTSFNIGSVGSSFTITTTGSPAPTISITGALPTGINFTDNNNGTGTLAGTAAAGTGGTYPLVITASNGVGAPATQNFTLTIQQGAAITSANATTFAAGAAGTFTVTTTGTPAATSILQAGSLPAGVSFTNNGNGTATLAGMPGAASGGIYALTFTASNGVGAPAVQNFTLTVQQAPAITSANNTTFTVGTFASFTVTTTGFPSAATIAQTGALPGGVSFTDNGDGTATLAGTAAAATGGTYPLTITASNGVGSPASQGFTLTVNQAAAVTSASSTAFTVGVLGTFTITTTGFPAPAIVRGGVALPSGVTFTDNGNGTGTLTGTPAASTGGSYALTFTAANGIGSPAVQNFTLTIEQAPAITSANSTTFTVGSAGSFSVTTTGFPVPSVVAGGTLPNGVTFLDNGNGTATLAGMPGAGTAGPYALTFTANNNVGSAAVQNFTLTVACPVVTLSPAAGALTTGTYQSTYNQVFGATGGTGHTFAVTAGALPPGMNLAADGTLSGPPSTTGNFSFTITATNSFDCTGSAAYTLAVIPSANHDAYNNGVGNTQYVVSPAPPSSTPAVLFTGTVLSNDAGPGTLTTGPAVIAAGNGTVALASNGAFVYTPNVGFAGPSDLFTYTLTDGNGMTDTATVTINLSGVVWFVNGGAAVNGDGRSHSPFIATNFAEGPSLPGHAIYVHAGAGTPPNTLPTAGAIVLKTNQILHGAGDPFTFGGLVIPFGGFPTLAGTVTLANGVTVSSVRINSVSGPAITGSNLTGVESLVDVNILGGSSGITFTNVGGFVGFNTVGIENLTAGPSLLINGGNGTFAGRLAITSTNGRSLDIQNKSGGDVFLGGLITDSGTGILLNNNSPATNIYFQGGLALNTGANAAFTATNAGTVHVCATSDCGGGAPMVNTITTSSGTALNVTNTAIGASGLTFRSISAGTGAGSAGVGISLNSTGLLAANGGLTVTGTGVAGSGGTIQHKTGADGSLTDGIGIVLQNTKNPSFNWMQLNDFDNSAIVGRNVQGFTLQNSVIDGTIGTSSAPVEGPINFGLSNPGGANGLQGTGLIRNTKVSGGIEHNLEFYNQSGSMTLTVDGVSAAGPAGDCRITSNSVPSGSDGILIEMQDNATATITVQRCYFDDNKSQAVQVNALNDTSVAVTLDSLMLTRTTQGNEGLILSNGGNSQMTAMVSNNTSSGFGGTHIFVGQTPGNATALSQLHASILNNVITMPATATNHGIIVFMTSTVGEVSQARIRIDGNNVTNNSLTGTTRGIIVDTPDASTSPSFHATVTNNSVSVGDNIAGVGGLVVQSRQSATAVANIHSNTVTFPNGNPGVNGLRARQVAPATYSLEQSASCVGTAASVLACGNPGSSTEVLGTISVVAAGSTLLPITP
jgi:hypothetical protein